MPILSEKLIPSQALKIRTKQHNIQSIFYLNLFYCHSLLNLHSWQSVMKDPWILEKTGTHVPSLLGIEGLFTLGSGYCHLRSSLEEALPGDFQNRTYFRRSGNVTAEKFVAMKQKYGTYVPGVFGQHPTLNRQMVNLPSPLGIRLIRAGEQMHVERARITDHVRRLDLRRAVLTRELVWEPQAGGVLYIEFERFVSAVRPQLVMQRVRIMADRALELDIEADIDADMRTSGYDHCTKVTTTKQGDLLCADTMIDTGVRVRVASLLLPPKESHPQQTRLSERSATFHQRLILEPRKEIIVEKRSAISTSRDLPEYRDALDVLEESRRIPWQTLLEEHCQEWEKRWEDSDVCIEGNPEDQSALRVSVYHLLRCHVPDDRRVAIDAKGYAGDAYFGHFFWDTEMYLLPFYLYTTPAKARSLVEFRLHTLDGAKKNATNYGYPGARYPWQSDDLGSENCSGWQYRDHEVHVTADVVYGWAHYDAMVPEENFLSKAAEALVETARYWIARMDQREGENFPSLLGVMGPNEYVPLASNNAYTNFLVKFVLNLAAGALGEDGGATAAERAEFKKCAELLPVPRSAKNPALVLECEHFESLAPHAFDQFWKDRSKGYYGQASQDRIYRSQNLKQADVIMLMMLFPQHFSDEEVRTAWEYYLPRTTHDSSLSAGVHAVVGCRLGLDAEAYEFWKASCGIDLDGGAAQGIHIASCGVNWQIAVFGFGGVATGMSSETLQIQPGLPAAWEALRFHLVWKGVPVLVNVTHGVISVENRGDRSIDAIITGQRVSVAAGKSVAVAFVKEGSFRITTD